MSSSFIAIAAAALLSVPSAAPAPRTAPDPGLPAVAAETAAGDWIVDEQDNVCGLKDARQLRNPAAVDYDGLLSATAEVKEMKRRGIDKDSPEGQVLFNKAVDRVRSAASAVMRDQGYDSVWKTIRHRRGQQAPDVTDEVKRIVEKANGPGGTRA